jgi:hypothetical protein
MGYRSPRGIGWGGPFDKARHVGQQPRFQTDRCLVLHVVPEAKDRTTPPENPRPGPESRPGARD